MTNDVWAVQEEELLTGTQPHALSSLEFRSKLTPGVLGELEHEKYMVSVGRQRFLDRQAKKTVISEEGKPRTIIDDAVSVVTEAIKAKHADEIGAHKRPMSWMNVWTELLALPRGAELMALAGLTQMMDAVATGKTLNSTLVLLGKGFEMELWSARLRQFDAKLHKRIEDKVRRDHFSLRYRIKAAKTIAGKEGFKIAGMTPSDHVKLGAPVMSVILASTDIFEIWEKHKADGKTVRRVGLTDAASDLIANYEFKQSWMTPYWQPMIVPPNDWTDNNTGAYLDSALSLQTQLVKHANKQQIRMVNHRIANGEMKDVLDAVNLMQRTPFKINQYILDAVSWAWADNKMLKKFPQRLKVQLPDRPDNWDEMDNVQRKGWIIDRRKIRERNREIDGGVSFMHWDLETANFLSSYDEFWVPCNMDFRGRIYPISTFSYHRDSHVKAMFLFARAKPIGEEGFKYLALKVADLGDFDKISKQPIADRLQWVIDNEEQICKVGIDFEGTYDYWSQADKPFEFLAACHEYYNAVMEGPGYLCGLPIGLDGSNSAAQHYSAAARSTEEGRMVNLTAEDKPQDIYQVIADHVIDACQKAQDPMGDQWLQFGITRSIVKRQTMTFGYGSAAYGFAQQIQDDLMRPLANDVLKGLLTEHPFGDDEGYAASHYMAKKVWAAVNDVIFKAAEGMEFFKQLANACSKENKLMAWSTPLGFPVVQRYETNVGKKIKLYLHDRETNIRKRTQVTVVEKREQGGSFDKVDKRKNRTSASPNVIHSMDACHLQMTVLNCIDNYRVRDFFLIHDSFGVMPADCPAMYTAVRQSFVELYSSTCLYSMLRNQVENYLDAPDAAELPEIPAKGDLDLNQVLTSQYCFL